MSKVPQEIVVAINGMLAPYGEGYTPGGAPESSSGYKSAKDAWRYLGVSKSTFYRIVRSRRITPIRLGKDTPRGKTVFAVADLERYVASSLLVESQKPTRK